MPSTLITSKFQVIVEIVSSLHIVLNVVTGLHIDDGVPWPTKHYSGETILFIYNYV